MPDAPEDRDQLNATLARKLETLAPRYGYLARRMLQGCSDEERLTIAQFRALQTIKRLGDPGATNLDLARSISVSPPAMTAMIDGLVERGFVTRTIDPDNRRQVLILITEPGDARLYTATESVERALARGINSLTEKETDDLSNGLNALEKVFSTLNDFDER